MNELILKEKCKLITKAIELAIASHTLEPLSVVYDDLVDMYENWYLIHDEDFRSGDETYGFGDVFAKLEYISDRWGGTFRVRWMIELINPNYILYGSSRQ